MDRSLVGTGQGPENLRYRMLETIRQFAGERLTEADDAAAISAAHCGYFVSVAEQAGARLTGPDQGRWFAALDAERANLWRAAEYAAGVPGGTSRVLRLGAGHRAARLHGAAQAFLDQVGGPWQDPEHRYREDSIAAVRRRLGDAQFDETYAHCLALSFDDAIALALGEARQAAA